MTSLKLGTLPRRFSGTDYLRPVQTKKLIFGKPCIFMVLKDSVFALLKSRSFVKTTPLLN